MEERPRRLTRRLATALAVFALAGGWAANARADIAYAFASQTISGITITPALTALTSNLTTNTLDSVTTNGSGFSQSAPTDVLQAFQGLGAAPAQNTFTKTANPPTFAGAVDFTRSDGLIQNLQAATNVSSAVSESFLNTTGFKTETADSGLSASFSFVAPANPTGLTFSYFVTNDLLVSTTGTGVASANYHFSITVKDAAGTVVFTSATPTTNLAVTAPPQGAEIIRTALPETTAATPVLTQGQLYTLIFSGTTQTSVNVGVPEPNVMMLVGASGALTLAVGAVRRRRQRIVTE